jgi:hypothetical protein
MGTLGGMQSSPDSRCPALVLIGMLNDRSLMLDADKFPLNNRALGLLHRLSANGSICRTSETSKPQNEQQTTAPKAHIWY